jgi:hypothetical protein
VGGRAFGSSAHNSRAFRSSRQSAAALRLGQGMSAASNGRTLTASAQAAIRAVVPMIALVTGWLMPPVGPARRMATAVLEGYDAAEER